MKKILNRSTVLALLTGLASSAFAQQTFSFNGPVLSIGSIGNPSNISVTKDTVLQGYFLKNNLTVNSATLTSVSPVTYSHESRILLTNSAYPNDPIVFKPFTGNSQFVSVAAVPGTQLPILGNLVGKLIPKGSNWNFEFYDSIDDGPGADASWTNISFSTQALAPVGYTYTAPNNQLVIDSTRDPQNTVVSLGAAPVSFVMDSNVYATGQLQRIDTIDPDQANIRLRNSAYPFHFADLRPAFAAFVGIPPVTNFNGVFPTENYMGLDLARMFIPQGSVWTAEFCVHEHWPDNDGQAEARFNNLSLTFLNGTIFPNGVAPAATTINLTGLETRTLLPAVERLAVKWYKFDISTIDGALDQFLDVYVAPNLVPNTYNDLVMGVYAADGRRVAFDDDDGMLALPAISIGDRLPVRPMETAPGYTDGMNHDGRDLEGVPSGTYYVALAVFSTGTEMQPYQFNVVTSDSYPFPAGAELVIRTNGLNQSTRISGNVNLQDWIPGENGRVVDCQIFDSADNLVSQTNLNLGVDGSYSISPSVFPGQYTIRMKSSHWLAQANLQVLNGASIVSNFDLKNGDVNNDNFVGFDDFDLLSAAFNLGLGDLGYNPEADLNGDDFVGFDDFDILSANFNSAGD